MSRGPLGLRAGTSGCREVSLELWGEVPAECGFGCCGHLGGEGSRTGVVDRGGAPGIPAGVSSREGPPRSCRAVGGSTQVERVLDRWSCCACTFLRSPSLSSVPL